MFAILGGAHTGISIDKVKKWHKSLWPMRDTCLNIITQLTVELHKDDISKEKLGTGVLYTNRKLSGVVYVLTAKHCLLKLGKKVGYR